MVKEDLEDILGAKVGPTAVFEKQRPHAQRFCQALQLPAAEREDKEKFLEGLPQSPEQVQLLQERAFAAASLTHHQHSVRLFVEMVTRAEELLQA